MFGSQVPVFTYKQPNGYADFAADTPAIPSFADVMWVYEDEGDGFAKNRYRKIANIVACLSASLECKITRKKHKTLLAI